MTPRRALTVVAVGGVLAAVTAGVVANERDAGNDETIRQPAAAVHQETSALRPTTSITPATTTTRPPVGPPRRATTGPDPTSRCSGAHVVASWPLRQRLGQLLMVGVPPTTSAAAKRDAALGVGGVFVGMSSTGAFTDGGLVGLKTPQGIPVAVAVDEEGGAVQRIDALAGSMPSPRTMASTMTVAQVRHLAADRGRTMKRYGITVDFAPVVDVAPRNSFIGSRSFADDSEIVTTYAGAFADGLRDAGITPTVKHFPGHGHADGDSHNGATVTPPLESLEKIDLIPYENLAASGAWVMVGHLDVPGLTAPGEPASISRAAIDDLLRNKLGFRGVVVSDELGGMRAVSARVPLAEAIGRHLAAGGDIGLFATDIELPSVLDHLERSVATHALDETAVNRSVLRVLAAKGYDPCRSDSQPSPTAGAVRVP